MRPMDKVAKYPVRTPWRWLFLLELVTGALVFGSSYIFYMMASVWLAGVIGLVIVHFQHAANG